MFMDWRITGNGGTQGPEDIRPENNGFARLVEVSGNDGFIDKTRQRVVHHRGHRVLISTRLLIIFYDIIIITLTGRCY